MNNFIIVLFLLLSPVSAPGYPAQPVYVDTVHVAQPTGERETDRVNILSAIEKVQPGGTVQFAAGKYVVGKVIPINIPQITLLGHPDGTILRGCEPDEFAEIQKALATVSNPTEGWAVVSCCGMLELKGGNVTVRNFTFEYTRLGLLLGSSHAEDLLYPAEGGYLIEENTIIVQRVPFFTSWPYFDDYPLTNKEDSTFVGIPLALYHYTETIGQNRSLSDTKENLIKGNLITGVYGLGIEISNASQNRIVKNKITGINLREPFPGNTLGGTQFGSAANGSGIWVSPGSIGDEIVGNTFEEVASHAAFIEGYSNRVEMHDLEDKVWDMGSGNQIHSENGKDTIRSVDQCIEETMLPHIEELKIPGASLVIMKDGRIILEETYGLASLELDVDVSPSTLFPYASIAKIFTGTTILRLVQDGIFSLDDSITELIPNLPKAWGQVTVRHLLSNTSGLPDLHEGWRFENPFIAPKKSWVEILENLTNRQADFAPGEGYAYNNTNYALLRMLIEQTDGRKIEEYVREEFVAVYGIESLRYGDDRDIIPGRATWYTHIDFNSETPQLGPIRPLWIEYPPISTLQ